MRACGYDCVRVIMGVCECVSRGVRINAGVNVGAILCWCTRSRSDSEGDVVRRVGGDHHACAGGGEVGILPFIVEKL